MSFRDDSLKAETFEIIDTLASIRVVGPKATADEILMELPNREQLRDMIIQRVKGRRNTDEQSNRNICTKYALKRVQNKLTSKSSTLKVSNEWVEYIDKEDERHEKLFYIREGEKMGYTAGAEKPSLYETFLPEPKEKQTKVKYDSLDYVIVEN